MNALEALNAYFPDHEGPLGPYGLLVGLAYLEENPATEPERREALLELLDAIAPLAKTLTDEQLEHLCEVTIGFFKLGVTLLMPHVVDAKKAAQAFQRTLGVLNADRAALQARARAEAARIWEAYAAQKYRLGEVATMVIEYLEGEGFKPLPKDEAVQGWIRDLAPEYAKKPGRPKNRK
ncbi:hypothetical protein [Pseudomonas plecoglossicida]|uniref:hypothetical protein n=1 Tax=Pseudomonas plecoglossicida TaxID=70775 RepID=UPI003D1B0F5E